MEKTLRAEEKFNNILINNISEAIKRITKRVKKDKENFKHFYVEYKNNIYCGRILLLINFSVKILVVENYCTIES